MVGAKEHQESSISIDLVQLFNTFYSEILVFTSTEQIVKSLFSTIVRLFGFLIIAKIFSRKG